MWPGADPGMCEARHDGEVFAKVLQHIQVGSRFVFPTCRGGKKVRRVKSERRANANHAGGQLAFSALQGGVQQRQSQGDASGTEKVAAVEFHWRSLFCLECITL